jgi:hypothetical protein
MRFHVVDTPHMYMNRSISALLQALACFVFALALVFSPPSASHAASSMPGENFSLDSQTDSQEDATAYGAISFALTHAECGSVSKSADGDDAAGQCCSGTCFSVMLDNTVGIFVEQMTSDKYLVLYAQTNSIEQSGFLRPPQFLI